MSFRPFRRLLAAASLATLALASASALAQTPIKFSLNFKPDGSNAAWFLAQERGYFKEAGLDVTMDTSGGTVDVLTRLATNAYDFGFADIGAVIEFAARNPGQAPISTLVVYDRSPLAVVALKKSGITKPGDMMGKVIGAPLSDGAYRMYPAFAKATKIDSSKVNFKNIDIRVRETLLSRGEVDAVMGFDSSVWFNLKALGTKIEDVNFIRYAEHGLDLYGNSLLVSRKMLKENPKAVAAFTRITVRAWKEAMADPKAAVAALMKRDPLIDAAIEIEKIQWLAANQIATPAFKNGGMGSIDRARLERQIDTIVEAFTLPARPALDAVYDGQFLPPVAERKF
jgi:NitT/TauT family transport system substrate-binding protein